ncbi:MAG: transglycosylase SLT domain-containing protein [Hyphomicrobiaceae bacterium]|nr:transglycosylase SLT domain-containing protein [Hyphomicrobiaceae bacterium]
MLVAFGVGAVWLADAQAAPRKVPLPDRNPKRAATPPSQPAVALPEKKPALLAPAAASAGSGIPLPVRVPGRAAVPQSAAPAAVAPPVQKPLVEGTAAATQPEVAPPANKPETKAATPAAPRSEPEPSPEVAGSEEKPESRDAIAAVLEADEAPPVQMPETAAPAATPPLPAVAVPEKKPEAAKKKLVSPHPDLVPPKRKPNAKRTAALSAASNVVLPRRKPEAPSGTLARLGELLEYDLSASDKRALKATVNAVYKGRLSDARSSLSRIKDPTARKLGQWYYYRRRGNNADPNKIAQFRINNPDWPSQKRLRLNAEEALLKRKPDAKVVKAFFGEGRPVTGPGKAALAGAFLASGDDAKAKRLISEAWRQHDFGKDTEKIILARFGKHLTDKDHKARVDRLLLLDRKSKIKAVLRTAKHLDEMERKKIDARIAVVRRQKKAKKLLAAIPEKAKKDDVGFYFSRIQWLRRHKKAEKAWKLLQAAPRDPDALIAINEWWIERRINVRKALNAGHPEIAYEIAKNHEPLSGNQYYEAEFLAGWIALRFLNKPEVSLEHFQALRTAASGPKTRAKAEYWLGRTAAALKKSDEARAHYEAAAKLPLTYYGQLSAQTLDPGQTTLHLPPTPKPTDEDLEKFKARDALQAIAVMRAVGLEKLAPLFFHQLARTIEDPAQGVMLAKLAHDYDQPHASVRLSKIALNRGLPLAEMAYPTNMFPSYKKINDPVEDALLYSLSRQESEFNPSAKSPVGARGLMQIMPNTARAIARQHKVRYRRSALTADPSYNVMLGVAHLGDLINSYRGSYILTLVAYNAGGGRVRDWTKEFGDPRDPDVDAIDWVERIPFTETRHYVKKILTGLQIFRARLNGSEGALRLWEDLNRGQRKLPAEARATSTAANN